MFGAVQFLNVLILTFLCILFFNLVKLTELPPVWERAANSAYHLLFRCLLRCVCSSFPLMFRTSFGFWLGRFLGVFTSLISIMNTITPCMYIHYSLYWVVNNLVEIPADHYLIVTRVSTR